MINFILSKQKIKTDKIIKIKIHILKLNQLITQTEHISYRHEKRYSIIRTSDKAI